eukprot:CAMPEP_0194104802 /NCGR_PEP_ID=MMETSP0150-20130528/5086_1 /TAXON_ID=122233 /ORGANISM="Chaetoceros debilis, Strain MM31A-1" /LENGTH=563 /DNA_ID=CAMNT_0038792451 /DNA_START=25 /DNA_END=1716 /DNA_ORIENTATION=-
MKHLINLQVLSVKGITVCDKDMKPDDFASIQISCVVGIGRKKELKKTGPSFPVRKTKATWPKEKDAVIESSMLSIETSLNNKRKKNFEVSILLVRGNEQMLIGTASLIFVSALLETEIEIPIYPLGSKRAMEIKNEAKTLKKKGSASKQINPFLKDAGAAQTVSFNGSDRGRIYSLQESASIRLKCVCLPKQYEDVFMHVEGILHPKTNFGAKSTPMVTLSPSPASFNLSSHFQAKQDSPPVQQNIQLDDTSAQRHGYHSSPHDHPHAYVQGGNLLVPYLEELPMLYNDLRSKVTQMNKDSMILLGRNASYIANSKIGLSLRNLLMETTNQFLSINKLGIRGFDPYVPIDFERTQPFLLTTRKKLENDLKRIEGFDFSTKANSTQPPPVDGYTPFAEYLERSLIGKNNDTALHQAPFEFSSEHIELTSHVSNEPSILTDPFPSMEISSLEDEARDYDMHDEGDFGPNDQYYTTRNYAYMYDETRDYGPTRQVVSADTVSATLEGGFRISETLSELSDILGHLDDQDDHFYDQSFNEEDDPDGGYQDSFESVLSTESTFTRSSF